MTSRMTTATERMTYGYGTDFIVRIRIRNKLHKHTDTERMTYRYGYGTDDITERVTSWMTMDDSGTDAITDDNNVTTRSLLPRHQSRPYLQHVQTIH